MRQFENQNHIVLRDNGFTAVALLSTYMAGERGELEIAVYRDGNKPEADKICVEGGKLSPGSRSASIKMLYALLREVFRKWSDRVITFDCPDGRRARIYAAMLKRNGINFNRSGSFFELAR